MLQTTVRTGVRALALCSVLVAGTPSAAAAEWHVAPLFGWTFRGSTTLVDTERAVQNVHRTYGAAGTLIGGGPLGVEGLFLFTPGFFQRDNKEPVTGSRTVVLMGNVVLAAPRGWNEYGLRPYASGGIGLLHAQATSLVSFNENLVGMNVGGGAVGFLSENAGLRFDLRHFRHLKPGGVEGTSIGNVRLSYWAATVGVVFRY